MRFPLELSLAAALVMVAACEPVHPAQEPMADAAAEEAGETDAGVADAGSALMATLTVRADGSAIATPILEDGRTYTMVASGEFKWGNCDAGACPGGAACGYERLGDAFHRSDDCWASTIETFEFISLYVDGEQVDWGAYRADHIYSRAVVGADASLEFSVSDCVECFGDNAGELEVNVYAGP